MRKKVKKQNADPKNTLTEEQQLFLQSAWLLYDNRERILSEPRMAYAPINMHNEVLWVGSKVFETATVGVYLDWWQECPLAVIKDENGPQNLLVRFVGSALTWANKCTMVAKDGTVTESSVKGFKNLWLPFIKICRRYADSEQPEQPLSLTEVVEKLKSCD